MSYQHDNPSRRPSSLVDDGPKDSEQPPPERRKSSGPDMKRNKASHGPSTAERRYTPNSTPSVRFPNDPADNRSRSRSRTKDRSRHKSDSSSESSRSPSRDRSRDRRRRSRHADEPTEDEKPWYKKKTVWTTVATLATVASLVPSAVSAQASSSAAIASQRSARASKKSANAVTRGVDASIRSADASIMSANAAANSAKAQGHQDHFGRYTGPPAPQHRHGSSSGSVRSNAGDGRRPSRPAIEYGTGSVRSSARQVPAGRSQW